MFDPFQLLGLPRAFNIDRAALQSAYLRRAAALHPDRFSDPLEQVRAQHEAAALNDARAILTDDERRANVLLTLRGGPAKEQDKSLPPDFLMEIMEVRQDMEAALAGGDAPERRRLEQWASDRREQHIESVRALFASLDESSPDPQRLANIRRELNAWRYIERMLEQLREAR